MDADKNNMNLWIGECLRQARESNKLTQREVAINIGISKNHLYVLEHGKCSMSVPLLVSLSEYLHTTPDNILGYGPLIDQALLIRLSYMTPLEQRRVLDMIRLYSDIF